MFIDDDEYEGGVDRHDCCAHVPIITCNWPPWDDTLHDSADTCNVDNKKEDMQKNQNYYIQLAVYTTIQIHIMYIIYVTIKTKMEKKYYIQLAHYTSTQ